MDDLPERQQRILEVIEEAVREQGYPPTVREIGAAVGLCSPASVQGHLGRSGGHGLHPPRGAPSGGRSRWSGRQGARRRCRRPVAAAAGVRWWAGWPPGRRFWPRRTSRSLSTSPASWAGRECFALRVTGTSMINAGILDGDIVVVKRQETADDGDIVVALLDDEATLKRFFRKRTRCDCSPRTTPWNPSSSATLALPARSPA